MSPVLVVCYSYTGNSRQAAQWLCSSHGWPLGEISDIAPRGRLRCLFDSLLRRRPGIRYDGPEPADFRRVVLVAPVWVYRLAGPMRSFVVLHRQVLPRVAVIATMDGAGATNVFAEVSRLLGHRPIAVASLTADEIADGSGRAKLLEFGAALEPGSSARQAPGERAAARA